MNKVEAYKHVKETLNMSIKPYKNLLQYIGRDREIIIYGAGNLGKQVYNIFKKAKIPTKAFLDKHARQGEKLFNIPIYKVEDSNLNDDFKLNSCVIIAILLEDEEMKNIVKRLEQVGFKYIINSYILLAGMLPYDKDNISRNGIIDEYKEILNTLELMEDDISRDIFSCNLRAHVTFDYENTLVNKDTAQYIKPRVPFRKGFSNFVDCGAFIGDTFTELINHYDVDNYIGFEPDIKAFKKLSDCIKNTNFNNAYLYPCAVAEKNYYASFMGENGGSSTLSEKGNQVVQVVKMDDVLKDIIPTMIKMDIEGAEVEALNGCKNTIITDKPDLSICIYHKVSDLWRIPLLLHEWVPEYHFYVRCHYVATMETVLYATV